ncbi:MAG: HAD hydrolase family protein [Nitrospirales bacterium]|nr:HAD hydrolase family protein [Nitrospirales bacterium]
MFATDVDGVLTDGGMYYSNDGGEFKKFYAHDGMGIKLLQQAGIITALITAEQTRLVARRGEKLAIPEIHQGVHNKLAVMQSLATQYKISLEEIAYMGDDLNDLDVLLAVGFSASPANAVSVVREAVHYVCQLRGGEGAVREVADLLLAARNRE